MKLYEDYCPRCPRPIIDDTMGRSNGPPQPEKCRDCTAKNLRDTLTAYVTAEWSSEKLQVTRAEATKGVAYWYEKQQTFLTTIAERVKDGEVRTFKIGNQAVTIDRRTDCTRVIITKLETP